MEKLAEFASKLDAWFSCGGVSGFFPDGWEWGLTEERSREADRTGTVVTNGGRLNLRTGAGMDYDIIDRLSPEEAEKFSAVPDGKGEAEPVVPSDAGGEMELVKAEEQSPEEEPASGSMFPLFGVFVLVFGGIEGFLFMQTRKKRQKEQAKPDPDGDYSEEEDVLELPDEDAPDEEEYEGREFEDDEPV